MKEYRTRLHVVLEIATWLILLATLLIAVYGIRTLPETIATHYNAAGEVDGYGSPATLLILPMIMILPLGIISLVIHFVQPEFWNTPFEVKEENAAVVYRDMTTMMHLVQVEIAVFMLYTQIKSFLQDGTGVLVATVLWMAVLFATIIIMAVRAWRHNRME